MTDEIYQAIADERTQQDTKWGTEFDDKNTPSDWAHYFTLYAASTAPLTTPVDLDERRKQLVKLAALAVAAIEAQDRVGIAPRHFEAKDMDSLVAHAILDMDDHGYSEGLGPRTTARDNAWEELVLEAEKATGRQTYAHQGHA